VNNLVLNTSPLILLVKTKLDWILPELAKCIVVPYAVVNEIRAHPSDQIAVYLETLDYLKVVTVESQDIVLQWDVGKGESAAISYAYTHKNFRPVLDDSAAKLCSFALGITPLGTGSLLIEAKRKGLIPFVGKALEEMRNNGMWISDNIIQMLAQKAGE